MYLLFSRGSGIFCLQESTKKLEQNVNLFGSTVESLLYRYGKVTIDLHSGKTAVGFSCSSISRSFEPNSNLSQKAECMSCFLMTVDISYLPISVSWVLFVCGGFFFCVLL